MADEIKKTKAVFIVDGERWIVVVDTVLRYGQAFLMLDWGDQSINQNASTVPVDPALLSPVQSGGFNFEYVAEPIELDSAAIDLPSARRGFFRLE